MMAQQVAKACNGCGTELTPENWNPSNQEESQFFCKGCWSVYRKPYLKNFRDAHKLELARKLKDWRYVNPETVKMQRRRSYLRNQTTILAHRKKKAAEMKREVLLHYTNGTLLCRGWDNNGCPFNCSDLRCLQVDHIAGGGGKQRRETGSGTSFYRWLKTQNFPAGFQVLCANCNWIKRTERDETARRYR